MEKQKFLEILQDLLVVETENGLVAKCEIVEGLLNVLLSDGSVFVVNVCKSRRRP